MSLNNLNPTQRHELAIRAAQRRKITGRKLPAWVDGYAAAIADVQETERDRVFGVKG